jgi:hypothetical protein
MFGKVNGGAWSIITGFFALLAFSTASQAQAEVISPTIRDSITFAPPHVAGDAEFNGNGPSVYVKVKFSIRDNQLVYSVYFKAKETKSDWTEASGWSSSRTAYTAPAGMRIDSLPKSEYELLITTMSGHSEKAFVTPLGRVTVWGDTKGKDAGVYTKIKLDMDTTIPMNVSMNAPSTEQSIPLPRTMTFTPPHTRGDKDYSGNGPRVVVDAWVEQEGQQLYMVVKMHAEETKSDWTTASGQTRSLFYSAPVGRRITAVEGTRNWPGLVSYYDSNHEVDKFNTSLGPVSVFGDHKGDDAGSYTKVVLGDINHSIVVKTEASTSQLTAPAISKTSVKMPGRMQRKK